MRCHMKEFKVLKVIDKFKGLYKKLGVNYPLMRLILQTKLTMDGRRTTTFLANNGGKEKPDKNQFYATLGYYAFIGIFICPILLLDFNMMYQGSIIFIYFMFMILTTFISDFSSVLLDLKDKNLISTKGVDRATLNCAKFTHIIIYILYLTLALVGASLLVSMKYGAVFFIVFLLEIILVDIFMISLTALAYFVILKFFNGEKLKDMINIVQILLSVGIIISYQVIPRLFSVVDMGIEFVPKFYHLLIPPLWFSAPLYIIKTGNYNTMLIIMASLAVIVPILSLALYMKSSNKFEKYLEKLNSGDEKKKQGKLIYKLSNIICKKGEERVFFNFSWQMMKGERNFKLKSYPNLALALVFPLIFLFISYENQGIREWFVGLKDTKYFVTAYFFAISIPNVIYMLRFTENPKGALVYKMVGIRNKKDIIRGSLKAFIIKLMMPIWAVLTVIFTFVFSLKVIPHMIIIFLASIPIVVLTQKGTGDKLPFSEEFKMTQSGGYVAVFICTMIIVVILAALHAGISSNLPGTIVLLLIYLVVDYLLLEKA
ncbi:MAG: hypothetical protein ACRC2K_13495, partial [Clostridium sp.]